MYEMCVFSDDCVERAATAELRGTGLWATHRADSVVEFTEISELIKGLFFQKCVCQVSITPLKDEKKQCCCDL